MKPKRYLRSKRLRGALFIAAGGKCQACGEELGAGWHADHVIPWSKAKRTNIHEMQALCPHCNLSKGAKVAKRNRTFQDEFIRRAEEVSRTGEKLTTAHVTPGGGKSRAALLFAKTQLELGAIDAVTYVGPRISLRGQVAEGVQEVMPGRSLRVADNQLPLMRDKWEIGYVTTIQAIVRNPEVHEHHAERRRVLLIVDEFHHYPGEDTGEDASWSKAIKRLADRAQYVLAMTGTVYRNKDSRGILWLKYDDEGRPLPCHIEYGRTDGIREGAKLRFESMLFAGPASFDREGVRIDTRIESPDARVKGSMTWELAGDQPFVSDSVLQGIAHWKQERASNPRAQALVVCRRQGIAREVHAKLKREAVGYRVALAISDEDAGAQAAVRAYRRREVEVLVSVDKAYEGLDAPATTHVICMRGVESQPWLEQCLDRATRIDYLGDGTPNPNKRLAYFFSTATPGMVEVLSRIEEEQGDALPEPKEPSEERGPGEERFPRSDLLFASIEHLVTREGSPEDQARKLIFEKYGREGTAEQIHAFGQAIALMQAQMVQRDETPAPDPDREEDLKRIINKAASRRDYREGLERGETNREIYSAWGKSRKEMGVAELEEVLEWLRA